MHVFNDTLLVSSFRVSLTRSLNHNELIQIHWDLLLGFACFIINIKRVVFFLLFLFFPIFSLSILKFLIRTLLGVFFNFFLKY